MSPQWVFAIGVSATIAIATGAAVLPTKGPALAPGYEVPDDEVTKIDSDPNDINVYWDDFPDGDVNYRCLVVAVGYDNSITSGYGGTVQVDNCRRDEP